MKTNYQEKINNFSSILILFIISTFFLVVFSFLFFNNKLSFIYFRAIVFLYVLFIVVVAIRLFFVRFVRKFAFSLGFKIITPFYLQPKIEGYYKKNWWQIHYVSKETGKNPSLLRTYIKLQWKEQKQFDIPKLDKYDNSKYKSHEILTIKHIIRPDKNYLLLKRKWFTFDKKKIYELMDLLLKVAADSEIKGKKRK